ncbi:hypothetical protein EV363DRAFT_1547043 [Boletus edulis]|nr:hypothetical protein EV363DRAFT_1547043 [Boletus edulis]
MVASFSEDVVHLSTSPARDSPSGQLAKRRTPILRNPDVPKANSPPYINLVAEGESLKAHWAALFDDASLKHLPERPVISFTRRSLTAYNVVIFNSPDSSFSPASSVLADEQDEEKYHVHRLLAVARSWLDVWHQLLSRRLRSPAGAASAPIFPSDLSASESNASFSVVFPRVFPSTFCHLIIGTPTVSGTHGIRTAQSSEFSDEE